MGANLRAVVARDFSRGILAGPLIGLVIGISLALTCPGAARADAMAFAELDVTVAFTPNTNVSVTATALAISILRDGYGNHSEEGNGYGFLGQQAPVVTTFTNNTFGDHIFSSAFASAPPESYSSIVTSTAPGLFAELRNLTDLPQTVVVNYGSSMFLNAFALGGYSHASARFKLHGSGEGATPWEFKRDESVRSGETYSKDTTGTPFNLLLAPRATYSFYNDYTITEAAAYVPEPSTWAAMLVGLGLAGVALRRRRPATVPARN